MNSKKIDDKIICDLYFQNKNGKTHKETLDYICDKYNDLNYIDILNALYHNKKIIDWFKTPYEYLSNFAEIPVKYDGRLCVSAESAFQMMKTNNKNLRNKIAKMTPGEAKKIGRHLKLRDDWEQVKDNIMYEIVLAKFAQNEYYRSLLMATRDKELIEGTTWNDKYWGINLRTREGLNKLGEILMKIRQEFIDNDF